MKPETKDRILDSIDREIFIVGKDFKILFANEKFLSTRGYSAEDVSGMTCHEAAGCDPPYEDCPLSEALRTGTFSAKRRTRKNGGGNPGHCMVTVYPLSRGENGGTFLHVEKDISERIKVEAEVRAYIKSLKQGHSG